MGSVGGFHQAAEQVGDRRRSMDGVLADGKELLLATDLEIEAELISLIYRYRWQIELFFKWVKSILGNRHLMAESPEARAFLRTTVLQQSSCRTVLRLHLYRPAKSKNNRCRKRSWQSDPEIYAHDK